MEKLAKGQRNQPQYDHRFVDERNIPVVRAAQPGAIGGQRQAGDNNSYEEGQRHEVEAEAPHRNEREVVKAPVQGQNQPDEEQEGRKIQRVVDQKSRRRVSGGKDRGRRVANEGGIEPVKAARSQGNQPREDGSSKHAIQHGTGA